MMFKKAEKKEAKIRLNINGPSGSGKTWTSLEVARCLSNGGKVALIDTEHGSASKYADLFDFDVLELIPPFHPDNYIEAIKAAAEAGYDVLIIDSLTHGWAGPGGVLALKDDFARQSQYNDYTAWGPAGKLQDALVEAILDAPMHVIATMRSKMKHAIEQVERGGRTKTIVRKIGLEPIQRSGISYEFDIVGDMDIENVMVISKTRCTELPMGKAFHKPGADLAEILDRWTNGVALTPDEILEREIEALSWSNFAERAVAEFGLATDGVKAVLAELDTEWWKVYKHQKMICWRYLQHAPPTEGATDSNDAAPESITLPEHLAYLAEVETDQDREDMEWSDFWQAAVKELRFNHARHASSALKKALGSPPITGLNKSQKWAILARHQDEKAE